MGEETMVSERRLERMRSVLQRRQRDLQVFLDDLFSSQNYSAIIRTCDSVGVMNLFYAVHQDEAFAIHKTITQGSHRWIERRRIPYAERAEFLKERQREGFQVLATRLEADSVDFRSVDFTRPTILVVGNEKEGISDEVAAVADANIVIPMMGMAQSLNVSVATAVILYEAQRQREAAGMYDTPQLDRETIEATLKRWIERDTVERKKHSTPPAKAAKEEKDLRFEW